MPAQTVQHNSNAQEVVLAVHIDLLRRQALQRELVEYTAQHIRLSLGDDLIVRRAMSAVDGPRIDAGSGVSRGLSGFNDVHADSPDSTGEIFTFAAGDFLSKMSLIGE